MLFTDVCSDTFQEEYFRSRMCGVDVMITWRESRRDGEARALGLAECSSNKNALQQNLLQGIEL
jgi:hypothetical protein